MLWSVVAAGTIKFTDEPVMAITGLILYTLSPMAFQRSSGSQSSANGAVNSFCVSRNAGDYNSLGNYNNGNSYLFYAQNNMGWNDGNGYYSVSGYTLNDALLNYFTYQGSIEICMDTENTGSYLSGGSVSEPVYLAEYGQN